VAGRSPRVILIRYFIIRPDDIGREVEQAERWTALVVPKVKVSQNPSLLGEASAATTASESYRFGLLAPI
jgi:hypothetical protein